MKYLSIITMREEYVATNVLVSIHSNEQEAREECEELNEISPDDVSYKITMVSVQDLPFNIGEL